MASSSKKKTTMSKLNRERKLRERRLDKQAKKDARKQASVDQQGQLGDVPTRDDDQSIPSDAGQPAPVIADRVHQARVVNALEPEREARFEPRSYGFRPGRGCQDAIQAVFAVTNPLRMGAAVAD
jgi:hypothetical protein